MSDTMTREFIKAEVPGAPLVPSVNLLPPQVKARRRLNAVRLWVVLGMLLVVLGVALVAVWAVMQKQSAEQDLVNIQDTNQALLTQQGQYAEVTRVIADLGAVTEARDSAMRTEVLWSPYLAAISSATPLEASIETFSVTQDTLWTGSSTAAAGPLATPGTVGAASLIGRADTLATVSDWEDALNALTGVVDVDVSSVAVADEDGTTYFTVNATFSFTSDAFAGQFTTEE
ncbi:hypothetical protein [Demequina iriomotensis]|uniref:hypothetical protein n=1 Tax=Demequina iriomotensis TaxID=1536641 RepID=UPI0007816502|nr:hypothetical protein [Demequina iriomotensis]